MHQSLGEQTSAVISDWAWVSLATACTPLQLTRCRNGCLQLPVWVLTWVAVLGSHEVQYDCVHHLSGQRQLVSKCSEPCEVESKGGCRHAKPCTMCSLHALCDEQS